MTTKRPPSPPDPSDPLDRSDSSEPSSLDASPDAADRPPLHIIVRRGALRRYEQLTRKAREVPIVVEWDRRQHNRREPSAYAGPDRRRSDRRQPEPYTWQVADFVIVAPPSFEGGSPSETRERRSIDWSGLRHARGAADDMPGLLEAALAEERPGDDERSAWFALWRVLCDQGQAYSASLAAVPYLVEMLPVHLTLERYDALLLTASIELARLEGRAPDLSADLRAEYESAVREARDVAEQLLPDAHDLQARAMIRGSLAVFEGDVATARTLLQWEPAPEEGND